MHLWCNGHKDITVQANQKPWLTGEVYRLLLPSELEMRWALKTAMANLSHGIREAKRQYSRGIAHRFSDSRDSHSLWWGHTPLRTTSLLRGPVTAPSPSWTSWTPSSLTLRHKTAQLHRRTHLLLATRDSVISRINAHKALGPDNIPARVLRDCAEELTDVFTDIFNISSSQAVVHTCFKATTIVPVPKKSSPSCFNDYRPVALTSILMKCFEWLVMHHIKHVLPPP